DPRLPLAVAEADPQELAEPEHRGHRDQARYQRGSSTTPTGPVKAARASATWAARAPCDSYPTWASSSRPTPAWRAISPASRAVECHWVGSGRAKVASCTRPVGPRGR